MDGAEVLFAEPGDYQLSLLALDGSNNVLASDTTTITVIPWALEIIAGADQEITLPETATLTGSVTPIDPTGVTMQWSTSAGWVSFGDPLAYDNTYAEFEKPGIYVLELLAIEDATGIVIGSDSVQVTVHPQELVVDAWIENDDNWGENDEVMLTDGSVSVDLNGRITGDGTGAGIQWSVIGGNPTEVDIDPDNQLNTDATFTEVGIYQIELRVTKGIEDYIDTVTIAVFPEQNGTLTIVEAGEYDPITLSARGQAELTLDDAWVLPIWSDNITTEWTADPSENLTFTPSASVVNPQVTFTQSGDYTLTLTVLDNGIPIDGANDTTTVTVIPNPSTDTDPPLIGVFTAEVDNIDIEDPVYASGLNGEIQIVVEATDAHMNDITITLTDKSSGQIVLEKDNISSVEAGTADNPQKLKLVYILPTYSIPVDEYTLTATATDMFGNETDPSDPTLDPPLIKTFTTVSNATYPISGFTVNPDTATPGDSELTFSATFNSSVVWNLKIYKQINLEYILVEGTTRTNTGASLSEKYDADTLVWENGNYKAILTVGDPIVQDAEVYFKVMLTGGDSEDLQAAITNLSNDDYQYQQNLPENGNPLPVISEGLFDLQGIAYHSLFPDDVYYKVEVIGDTIRKNVTPPYQEEGWRRGYVQEPGSLGELDLSGIPNGVYELQLTVKCNEDRKPVSVDFVLDCPLKVGNVQFSQEDIAIPVGGMPLRVVRTYNSLHKEIDGEFGYGWSYSLASMDIQLNERRSGGSSSNSADSWTQRIGGAFDRDVTLTLPDGRRATFTSYMQPVHSVWPFGPDQWEIKYKSPDGVKAILTTTTEEKLNLDLGTALVTGTGLYWWDGYEPQKGYHEVNYDGVDLSLHDISGYILTMEDGTNYSIERKPYPTQQIADPEGSDDYAYEYQPYGKPYLASIKTVNGGTITFDVDETDGENPRIKGIKHYEHGVDPDEHGSNYNKTILIEYDPITGNISAIYPPSEVYFDTTPEVLKVCKNPDAVAYLKYTYDGYGNLIAVEKLTDLTDRADPQYETITYVYGGGNDDIFQPSDHYITDIQDPRGFSPIRYVYDDEGRLIATFDAKGNYIELQHDITGNAERVIDRSGNVTDYFYNDRGNVTLVIQNPEGENQQLTGYAYDEEGSYPDLPTMVRQLVALPDVWADTVTSYNAQGWAETVTDPVGNITRYTYDDNGNILTIIQRLPDQTEVSTTINTYYYRNTSGDLVEGNQPDCTPTNLLARTQITKGGTTYSESVNVYDPQNYLLTSTAQIDPTGPLAPVVTEYAYVKQSGDPDYITPGYTPYPQQPYRVTDPSGVHRYSEYDTDGRLKYSYHKWVNPANTNDTCIVCTESVYDAAGRVIQSKRQTRDAATPVTILTEVILNDTMYNTIGKVDFTINEHNVLTLYEYDELGNVVETLTFDINGVSPEDLADYIDNPDNALSISRTLYDASGRTLVSVGPYEPGVYDLEQSKWPVGTENVYDALGRVAETRRWSGVEIPLADLYGVWPSDKFGRKVPEGVEPRSAWGSFAGETGPPPAELNVGWTTNGLLPITRDVTQGELSYSRTEYDVAGRTKHSISLDDGGYEQPTGYKYDKAGRQICVADPGDYGLVSGDYTAAGNFYVLNANGNAKLDVDIETIATTSKTHHEGTRRDYVTDDNGNINYFTYDELGRVIKTTHPATTQNPVTYSHVGYDGLGRKFWQSIHTDEINPANLDPETEIKWFEYDMAGRLIRTTIPKPKAADSVVVYDYFYDTYGNQVGILDKTGANSGRLTVFKYNEMSQQVAKYMPFVVDPATIADAASVYAALATALGGANPPAYETRQYDDFGRLAKKIDYDGVTTLYWYNLRGQLDTESNHVTDPSPGKLPSEAGFYPDPMTLTDYTTFDYDTLGRRVEVHQYEDGAEVHHEIFTYDAEGRVVSITTPDNSIGYGYYAVTGRKMLTRTPAVGDLNDITDHGSAMTQTSYTYDALGRLKTTSEDRRDGSTAGLPRVTTYNYDAVGNRDDMTLPNGIVTDYQYDELNRLLSVSHDTGVNLATYNYTLADDGMRTNIGEIIMSVGGTIADDADHYTRTYAYDNLNRLDVETATEDGTSTNGYSTDYDYDSVGNRTLRTITIQKEGELDKTLTHQYFYDDPGTTEDDGKDRLWKEIITDSTLSALPKDHYPVYMADGGGGGYKLSWRPLPSKMWKIGLYASFVLAPTLLFVPLLNRFRRKEKKRDRKLLRRGVTYLLIFLFLVGPFELQVMADNANLYDDLQTTDWSSGATEIVYEYYATGALKSKTVSGTDPHSILYEYNYRNRLARVTESRGTTDTITEYTYNYAGIRVKSHSWIEIDSNPQGDDTYKTYLIDPANHTGYAQVLEEWSGGATPDVTYTIGDDVISQSKGGVVSHLLYDGHGSTRQLSDNNGAITDCYSYDAYGMMLGGNPATGSSPTTNLLYAGEQFDTNSQNYYLRARYYDPSNGRFNRLDPYAGNNQDPQSLHKYLYCHANPVNGIDPSGKFTLVEFMVVIAIIAFIASVVIPALHNASERAGSTMGEIDRTQAVTLLEPGLQEEIWRDIDGNPMYLSRHIEMAEKHKLAIYQTQLVQKNVIDGVDAACHAVIYLDTALGFFVPPLTGVMRKVPVHYGAPHPNLKAGKPNPHWEFLKETAERISWTSNADAIYTHRGLSTLTNQRVKVRLFPDICEVMPDGKLRITQIFNTETKAMADKTEKAFRKALEPFGLLESYTRIKVPK